MNLRVQVSVAALQWGWSIKEAIDYPRLHHQLVPPEIQAQRGFPEVL